LSESPPSPYRSKLVAPRLDPAQPRLGRVPATVVAQLPDLDGELGEDLLGRSDHRARPRGGACRSRPSMSRWMTVALGAKASSLPVTRSSKRARRRRARRRCSSPGSTTWGRACRASRSGAVRVSGNALFPISVVTTGRRPASARSSSSAQASALSVPPPT
jgi:hypothetical protein